MSDPLREPQHLLATAFSPLATLKDKALTLKLIATSKIDYQNISPSKQTANDNLVDFGFSQKYINNFFIPFFSGVFLNRELNVNSDFFRYLFHKFSKAYAHLPEKGMAAIPTQMANEVGLESVSYTHLTLPTICSV